MHVFPVQTQWWSTLKIHSLHISQCWARGGTISLHGSQNLNLHIVGILESTAIFSISVRFINSKSSIELFLVLDKSVDSSRQSMELRLRTPLRCLPMALLSYATTLCSSFSLTFTSNLSYKSSTNVDVALPGCTMKTLNKLILAIPNKKQIIKVCTLIHSGAFLCTSK